MNILVVGLNTIHNSDVRKGCNLRMDQANYKNVIQGTRVKRLMKKNTTKHTITEKSTVSKCASIVTQAKLITDKKQASTTTVVVNHKRRQWKRQRHDDVADTDQ